MFRYPVHGIGEDDRIRCLHASEVVRLPLEAPRPVHVINLVTSVFIMVSAAYIGTEVWGMSNQMMGLTEAILGVGSHIGGALVATVPE